MVAAWQESKNNPYFVAKSGGFTKHFFIESQRIVSKLGESSESTDFEAVNPAITNIDYTARVQYQHQQQSRTCWYN